VRYDTARRRDVMTQIFEGLKVLDFTEGMLGGIATMVLSDYGAEVIKVEPPGGHESRTIPAAIQWNRSKKSVILDLETPEGREQANGLSKQVDVVIESFRPGTTQRLGIDYETLSAEHPDLVYCSLTGWGAKGPYAHYKPYEGAVAAKVGRMMVFAEQSNREGPHYSAVQTATHAANMAAVRGIIAALHVRDTTGQGQKVETSLMQAINLYEFIDLMFWQMMVRFPDQFSEHPWLRGYPTLAYLPVRTKDGQWIQMANIVQRLFVSMLHDIGLGHIFEDPRFEKAPVLLPEDREELRVIMLERFQEKTLDEWMDLFVNKTRDVAAEPYMTAEEGMNHPQIMHNGHVQDVQDPLVGKMRQLGPISLMSDTPGNIHGPAPFPGQHTQDVLDGLSGSQSKKNHYGSAAVPKYPLEGVTVLDLATVIAGPLGCALLGEMGARVIRIEAPGGDLVRGMAMGVTANKTMAASEGMCLDLSTPEGQKIVHDLVAKADILVHNMRPGAPERVGIGYEQLREINPGLVYVYAGGYGPTGPHSHRPSMHPIPGAVCGGVVTQMGAGAIPSADQVLTMDEIKEVSRRFGRANEGNPDPNSSMAVSVAALLGFYARKRTGKGQYITSSMLQANAYANADDFFSYEGKPPRALPDADGYGLNALYRLYEVQKGWVFLACPLQEEWQALCETIERRDLLEDPRFATPEDRKEHDGALTEELGKIFATREPLEWEHLLTSADVTCVKAEDSGPYQFLSEDPHVEENGYLTEVESLRFGNFLRYSPIVRFSHTTPKVGPGPLRGQHNEAVLLELGYRDEQIKEMEERGIIGHEDLSPWGVE
jgi:crotonobetainyl-CoA:carnitine CoA-transferase CaiB-like acyl-CoA transferase